MARTNSSHRCWTRIALSTTTLLALSTTLVPSTTAKLYPHKRTYDSHVYYVVEVDSTQLRLSNHSVESIAHALGGEHVEQVGELKDHYLIRAEQEEVDQGEESWEAIRESVAEAEPGWKSQLIKRDTTRVQPGKRDKVMERYELLRRELPGPATHLTKRLLLSSSSSTSSRSSPSLIRSLERQTPRLRVKRDLPVLPSSEPFLTKIRRNALLLDLPASIPASLQHKARQTAGIISQAASHFGILDPLWPRQWHLVNGVMEENSINVTGVWDEGVFGKGVNVAIVDDGLDMHSDDLAANFVSSPYSLFFHSYFRLIEIFRLPSTLRGLGITTTTLLYLNLDYQMINTVLDVQERSQLSRTMFVESESLIKLVSPGFESFQPRSRTPTKLRPSTTATKPTTFTLVRGDLQTMEEVWKLPVDSSRKPC